MNLQQLDTPALLVDLDVANRNLDKMADFFANGPTCLRPHYKNHKSPMLALLQVERGAIGMTCATLSEAEVLVTNGIKDILISSEVAGDRKVQRYVDLALQADVKVVVDNVIAIKEIGAAARSKKCSPVVVLNIDVGQNRTGVSPGELIVELGRKVLEEGLHLCGIMGYEGHVAHLPDGVEKNTAYIAAMNILMKCRSELEQQGIYVDTVSAGGTGTYKMAPQFPRITEFQAGSYLMMDTNYAKTCTDFECALSVFSTVISRTGNERLVVDAGLKAISGELGLPTVKSCEGLRFRKLNAEHGILDILDSSLSYQPGDTIEIWPVYSDATINLHRRMYGVRNGEVKEILKVEG